jgi:tRNA G46 methylase TrmB
MHLQARAITTNQLDINLKLESLVLKYKTSENLRPVSEHTRIAFEQTSKWLAGRDQSLIFDSCCGVGESTAKIASAYPESIVIGLDKSAVRLNKHLYYAEEQQNYLVVRADVNDFWRLARQAGWSLHKHFLLYPNPYPKSAQVQKRWHACPAMPELVMLGGNFQVRSNWQLYLREFQLALNLYDKQSQLSKTIQNNPITTPFERKYKASGQICWQLNAQL